MIMRPGQQLLLPASPLFIWGSLFAALGLNMLQNMGIWGRAAWVPDFMAAALVFWCVHQPLRVGIGSAFFFGLLMDVHQGSLLGQHALAYTLLGFLALVIHRRLLWFSVPTQVSQVLPLFVAAHVVELTARLISGASFPGWPLVFAPFLEAALWPVMSVLLLMPQKRAPEPDANRPL